VCCAASGNLFVRCLTEVINSTVEFGIAASKARKGVAELHRTEPGRQLACGKVSD
jgi:hypothetical protein